MCLFLIYFGFNIKSVQSCFQIEASSIFSRQESNSYASYNDILYFKAVSCRCSKNISRYFNMKVMTSKEGLNNMLENPKNIRNFLLSIDFQFEPQTPVDNNSNSYGKSK